MSMEFTRDDIIRVFVAESEDSLALVEQMLVVLETGGGDDEVINAIFRAAHTMKGNAASLGFEGLASLAHAMEDLLDELRARRFAVTPAFVTLLLHCCDAFRQMIPAALAEAHQLTAEATRLIAALETAKRDGVVTESAVRFAGDAEPQELAVVSGRKLRVDLARLDVILDLTGELSIAGGRLADGVASLNPADRERLRSASMDVERILSDLQEQVTRVRMVPIGPRFEQQRRAVRDLAHAAGKPVRFVIEGADVEIDASVVEQIKDALTHIVRNAVDHGIESRQTRLARGKEEAATLRLRARHDGGAVVIEVSDDGGGFDRERILARAVERGMVSAGHVPADEEIFGYVFAPGFTTADTVTEMSGRGVGMDVVSRAVSAMRGTVQVSSKAGVGSAIVMRLPLTLAIVRGLVLDGGGERFVVPIDALRQCAAVPLDEPRDTTYGLVDLDGRVVPYVRLRELFELRGAVRPAVEQMVIISSDSTELAIVADDLVGEMQAVIKPLGPLFRKLAGVSSSTIFPDGRVGLILDIAELVRRALRDGNNVSNEKKKGVSTV